MSENPEVHPGRFYERLSKLYEIWQKEMGDTDAMVFLTGRASNQNILPNTISLHHWLLGYHFTDTLMVFTKDTLSVLSSTKKHKMLEHIPPISQVNANTTFLPKLNFIVKAKDVSTSLEQIQELLDIQILHVKKLSFIPQEAQGLRDLPDQDYAKAAIMKIDQHLKKKGVEVVGKPHFVEQCRHIYDENEQGFLKVAGFLSSYHSVKLHDKIKSTAGKRESKNTAELCSEIENQLHAEKQIYKSLNQKFIKIPIDHQQCQSQLYLHQTKKSSSIPLLTLPVDSKGARLINKGAYYISCISRYQEYVAQCMRTVFNDIQIDEGGDSGELFNQYCAVENIHEYVIQQLVPGITLEEVYINSYEFVKKNYPHLISKMPTMLGYGIGAMSRLETHQITKGNKKKVKVGECYLVSTILNFLKTQTALGDQINIGLSDTVLIERSNSEIGQNFKQTVLTRDFASDFGLINTSDLKRQRDDGDVEMKKEEEPDSQETVSEGDESLDSGDAEIRDENILQEEINEEGRGVRNLRKRLRNKDDNLSKAKTREEDQYTLRSKKTEDLIERIKKGILGEQEKGNINRYLHKLKPYPSKKDFQNIKLKRGQIQIDPLHEAVLLPIGDKLVPIHMGMIKNVSKNEETVNSILRINFFTPESQGMQSGVNVQCPQEEELWYGRKKEPGEEGEEQQPTFIKEMIFRSSDKDRFNAIFKGLKEATKRIRTKEQERKEQDSLVAQPKLEMIPGKRLKLNNVTLRPSLTNRKTVGNLEIQKNGYRFVPNTDKGGSGVIDIIHKNIKHAFYQPASDDVLIVIIHFHLKQPIMIGNKKRTNDIQFYREVTAQYDDIGGGSGGANKRRGARSAANRTDFDEVELERQQRQYKKKLNTEFRNFCRAAQEEHEMRYEKPERQLGFYGVPSRSNMFIMPTVQCLVAISEMPFFVMSVDSVDIVHFERVNYSSKSFDVAFIYKDLTTWKRISNVPIESLESLKDWANSKKLIFSEGAINMNWQNVLAEIRGDLEGFLEQGGWNFLIEDDSEEGEEEEEENGRKGGGKMDDGDSSFDASSDFDEESESQYSSQEESDAESSEFEPESLEDEGLSWEEMEKQAVNEERKQRTTPVRSKKQGRR